MFLVVCNLHTLAAGSRALSSQIPMMLYQKALTGVFVGAVFHSTTDVFVSGVATGGSRGAECHP